jgi:uncharacterized protein (DUF2147 family)
MTFERTHDRRHASLARLGTLAAMAAALGAGAAVPSAAAGDARSTPAEAGVWIDDTGKGAVKIEVCGGKLCGRIYWLRETTDANGRPLMDRNNPDPDKQARPICGLPVLGNLEAMPEGGYDAGWVYDPKVGKSYSVAIELANANKLRVTGYAGVKFLGKSFIWTRAETELPPCAKQQAKRPAKKSEELPWATNAQ